MLPDLRAGRILEPIGRSRATAVRAELRSAGSDAFATKQNAFIGRFGKSLAKQLANQLADRYEMMQLGFPRSRVRISS
jgi:hypothetical protein